MAPIPLPSPFGTTLHLSSAPLSLLTTPISTVRRNLSSAQLPRLSSRALGSTLNRFLRRQTADCDANPGVIPCGYAPNNGPQPGTIAGIVLGSIGGLLLLLWLLYSCLAVGRAPRGTYTESVVFSNRNRKSRTSRSARSRRTSETVEVRTRVPSRSRSPVRIVREETIRREPPIERVIVEESRRESVRRSRDDSPEGRGSDEVVVIEEHSPPRRQKSKKSDRIYEERRESGFRTVDPGSFGGVVGGGRRGSGSRR